MSPLLELRGKGSKAMNKHKGLQKILKLLTEEFNDLKGHEAQTHKLGCL